MPAELKMCEFAAGETYHWDEAAGHDPTQTVGTYNLIFLISLQSFSFFFKFYSNQVPHTLTTTD